MGSSSLTPRISLCSFTKETASLGSFVLYSQPLTAKQIAWQCPLSLRGPRLRKSQSECFVSSLTHFLSHSLFSHIWKQHLTLIRGTNEHGVDKISLSCTRWNFLLSLFCTEIRLKVFGTINATTEHHSAEWLKNFTAREMAAELNSHQLCRNQCETLFSSNWTKK